MNNVFSKVWSKRLGHLVVASEHARLSGGKAGSGVKKVATALLMASSGLVALSHAAESQADATHVQLADIADDMLLGDGVAVQAGDNMLAIAPEAGVPMLMLADAGGIAPLVAGTQTYGQYVMVDNDGASSANVANNTRGIAAGYGASVLAAALVRLVVAPPQWAPAAWRWVMV